MSDIELQYVDRGTGTPAIVFIHGFASGPEDWAPQAEYFAGRHRVVSVALRGHGTSERGTAEMTIEQLAADCLAVLEARGIDRAILAGHSMGTRVAIEGHRQAPDRVCGLILLDGSNATALTTLDDALGHFDRTIAERGYLGFAEPLFAQMFFDPKHNTLKQKLVARALKVPEETGKPLYQHMIRYDASVVPGALQMANVPILVIQSTTRSATGARRTLEPGEVGVYENFVLRHAPGADIVTMAGLGHYTMLEAPAEVNQTIEDWMARHHLRA